MRRSTIVYLVLFAIVFGAAYYFNSRPKDSDATATPEATEAPIEYLFTAEQGLPTRIYIQAKDGQTVEVARDEANAWVITQPEEAPADQASVEAAASQIGTMRILNRVPDLAPDAVGLDHPDYIIKVAFQKNGERIIKIGVLTPTESGYYVSGEDGSTMIVSKSSIDPLLGLITNPPYAPTELPTVPATP
ncbi:MAG: DUF4340 domain-containing protein [Anaerolineales bacterium]|nr:DUF4340 domain-containing protein [Anaerolineales bacterium]